MKRLKKHVPSQYLSVHRCHRRRKSTGVAKQLLSHLASKRGFLLFYHITVSITSSSTLLFMSSCYLVAFSSGVKELNSLTDCAYGYAWSCVSLRTYVVHNPQAHVQVNVYVEKLRVHTRWECAFVLLHVLVPCMYAYLKETCTCMSTEVLNARICAGRTYYSLHFIRHTYSCCIFPLGGCKHDMNV